MCSSAKIDYLKWAALALVVQYFWKQFHLIVEICVFPMSTVGIAIVQIKLL